MNFSSVDSLGRILTADVVNRGAGYTSIPSLAVADASCLCQLQVGIQMLSLSVFHHQIHAVVFNSLQMSLVLWMHA